MSTMHFEETKNSSKFHNFEFLKKKISTKFVEGNHVLQGILEG